MLSEDCPVFLLNIVSYCKFSILSLSTIHHHVSQLLDRPGFSVVIWKQQLLLHYHDPMWPEHESDQDYPLGSIPLLLNTLVCVVLVRQHTDLFKTVQTLQILFVQIIRGSFPKKNSKALIDVDHNEDDDAWVDLLFHKVHRERSAVAQYSQRGNENRYK